MVGLAYKPGIDDLRESPALDIVGMLAERGAQVSWYDPHAKGAPSRRARASGSWSGRGRLWPVTMPR